MGAVNEAPQALLHLREAARLEPESAEVRGWLATAYMAMGALPDARREIDAALELDPHELRLLATAGEICAAANDPERAEQYLQQAIALNPQVVPPQVLLARIYAHWQRWDRFNETLQRIAAIDPQSARQLQQAQMQGAFGATPPGALGAPGYGPVNPPIAAAARKLFDWLGGDDGGKRR